MFLCWGSLYSKRPAWDDGFYAKIGFEKFALGEEILAKTCKNMKVWFGNLNFGIFCLIYQDSLHIFQKWFLHWNSELMPVILSTMNHQNGTIFFLDSCYLKLVRRLWNFKDMFFYIIYKKKYYQAYQKFHFLFFLTHLQPAMENSIVFFKTTPKPSFAGLIQQISHYLPN